MGPNNLVRAHQPEAHIDWGRWMHHSTARCAPGCAYAETTRAQPGPTDNLAGGRFTATLCTMPLYSATRTMPAHVMVLKESRDQGELADQHDSPGNMLLRPQVLVAMWRQRAGVARPSCCPFA